jgi:pyrimidine-nucleoside phosphorylase
MNAIDIINKKRLGLTITFDEIAYMINNYVNGSIEDYQMSAFLMAVCINGMTDEEIFELTDIMINSGEVLDFSYLKDNLVDKHSTGGVGDKTTLVLAPLVASCGVDVVKMSGRGLGFTGGTIDKLESIKGFKTSLTKEEIKSQIEEIRTCIVSGNDKLVPADKKIYALRDVTGTVESIPLIASSIMSKKIAGGAKKIVIDVKVGKGALMKNKEDALKLAHTMIEIGKKYNVKVICVLSNMQSPLGYAIGNGIEVKESIDALNGIFAKDFYELIITLASSMVSLGLSITLEEAKKIVCSNIENKKGYNVFLKLVEKQHGNINMIDISDNTYEVKSVKEGYISKIDAYTLAGVSNQLGSGRKSIHDNIDYGVGLWLLKKPGDYVNKGDSLVRVYLGSKKINDEDILNSFTFTKEMPTIEPIILEIIK